MCGTQVASSKVTICISSECAPVLSTAQHSTGRTQHVSTSHTDLSPKPNARTCFGWEHNNQYLNETNVTASSWICVTNCANEYMKQSHTSEADSRLPSCLESHLRYPRYISHVSFIHFIFIFYILMYCINHRMHTRSRHFKAQLIVHLILFSQTLKMTSSKPKHVLWQKIPLFPEFTTMLTGHW